MTTRTHPAAYLHESPNPAATAIRRHAAAARAARLGWPPPALYADTPADLAADTPALTALAAAIEAGRHDALLITGPAATAACAAARLTTLLRRCTRNGVTVSIQLPAPPDPPETSNTPPPVRHKT